MDKKTIKVKHVFTKTKSGDYKDVCTQSDGRGFSRTFSKSNTEGMIAATVRLFAENPMYERLIIDAELTIKK